MRLSMAELNQLLLESESFGVTHPTELKEDEVPSIAALETAQPLNRRRERYHLR